MAECAVCARPPAQAWAALGGICWRVPSGENVRWAVPGADHPLLVAVTTVMMGDIGEEITEIELEPLPEEIPTEEPVEPVPEPAPG